MCLVVALLTTACGSDGGAPTPTPSPATDEQAVEATGGSTSELLGFTSPAIGGGQVEATAFQGRPTLLWFWAPW